MPTIFPDIYSPLLFSSRPTHALDEECQEISIMMLGSGLERFCRSLVFLMRNTQECATSLDIEVGPICSEKHVRYKNDMTRYFSKTIQKVFLNPFLAVQDYRDVEIYS